MRRSLRYDPAYRILRQHPEIVRRADEQLRVISLRLCALLATLGSADPGYDLKPLTHDWLLDIYEYEEAKLKVEEEALKRARRG